MGVASKLQEIQSSLKAPKGQYNSFGKYNYRSCEDILEALKEPLRTAGAVVTLCDDVRQVGERYYIVATASIVDSETGESISVQAMARESETKKGMDDSQITGTASSYARKYALNGLFLIDDTKDSDTNEAKTEKDAKTHKGQHKPKQEMTIGAEIDALVKDFMKRTGKDSMSVGKVFLQAAQNLGYKSPREVKSEQRSQFLKEVNTLLAG